MHLSSVCKLLLVAVTFAGINLCDGVGLATSITANSFGKTDQIFVTWKAAEGPVDYYLVNITGNTFSTNTFRNTFVTFTNLLPGSKYAITIETVSGPYSNTTEPVYEATYPTPPGPLLNEISSKDSIRLVWKEPENMANVQKTFAITLESFYGSHTVSSCTPSTELFNLTPGRTYIVSIVTVGAYQYKSAPVIKYITVPQILPPAVIIQTATSNVMDSSAGIIAGAVVGSVGGFIIISLLVFSIQRFVRNQMQKPPIITRNKKMTHVIKSRDFEETLFQMSYEYNNILEEEFLKLESHVKSAGHLKPLSSVIYPGNTAKNQLDVVSPYDHSRVKLSNKAYINASYIPGQKISKEFIATPNPQPGTVREFWQMVWEHRVRTIVMLSRSIENGEVQSERYWPVREPSTFGDITIIPATVPRPSGHNEASSVVRDFIVINVTKGLCFPVRQFQYTAWVDNAKQDERRLLIQFVKLVHQHSYNILQYYPTLVHCGNGSRRSGTFIALSRIVTQLEDTNAVDVFGTVYDLLTHRPSMIDTLEQYKFLYRCTEEIIKPPSGSHENATFEFDQQPHPTAAIDIFRAQDLQSVSNPEV